MSWQVHWPSGRSLTNWQWSIWWHSWRSTELLHTPAIIWTSNWSKKNLVLVKSDLSRCSSGRHKRNHLSPHTHGLFQNQTSSACRVCVAWLRLVVQSGNLKLSSAKPSFWLADASFKLPSTIINWCSEWCYQNCVPPKKMSWKRVLNRWCHKLWQWCHEADTFELRLYSCHIWWPILWPVAIQLYIIMLHQRSNATVIFSSKVFKGENWCVHARGQKVALSF